METELIQQDVGMNKPSVITQVLATAQINIALTQQSYSVQRIQDEINSLIFNEDNMQSMADVINKLNKIDKIIEGKHKEGKAPYLEGGKIWDAAKNSALAITDSLRNQVSTPYNKICADIDKRRRAAAEEQERVNGIVAGIENNVINFATKVSSCETLEQLLSVERTINLEKSPSRKEKYAEYHDLAINRYDFVLIPVIKNQKDKIKQKDLVTKQLLEAENADNAQKVEELLIQKEQIDNEILQNQVNVQQNAISQITTIIPVAEEVLPKTKSVDTIKFEIADIGVAVKKCPELLDITIKFRECQKLSMALKDAGTFDNKSEVVVNGIKFFIDKTFRP